ncbi:Multidrug resistance protein MdtC [Castellaniella defragrans]
MVLRLSNHYVSALDWVIAHQGLTMLVFAATLVITALLVAIPKNLFPEQDTGQIAVTTVASEDIGYASIARLRARPRRRS